VAKEGKLFNLTGVSPVFYSPWPNTVSLPAPLRFLTLAAARIRSVFELAAGLRTAQASPSASLDAGTLLLAGNNPGYPTRCRVGPRNARSRESGKALSATKG
jgi:hypothetical protein